MPLAMSHRPDANCPNAASDDAPFHSSDATFGYSTGSIPMACTSWPFSLPFATRRDATDATPGTDRSSFPRRGPAATFPSCSTIDPGMTR